VLDINTDDMLKQIAGALNSIGNNEQILANAINESMLILRAELVQNANKVYDRRGKKLRKTDLKISRATYSKFANAMVTAKGYKNDLSYFNYSPFEVVSTGRNAPGGYQVRVRAEKGFSTLSGTGRHSKGFLVKFDSGHMSIVQRTRSKSEQYKSAAGLAARKALHRDTRRIIKLNTPSLPNMISARDVYDPAERVFGENVQDVLQKHIAANLKQARNAGG